MSASEENRSSKWLDDTMEKLLHLCPKMQKEGEYYYSFKVTKMDSFPFVEKAKELEKKHGVSFEVHIIDGPRFIAKQNKHMSTTNTRTKSPRKPLKYTNKQLGYLKDLKTLYSKTFDEPTTVWNEFETNVMKKGINMIVLMSISKKKKTWHVVGGTTITGTNFFSVLNMFVVAGTKPKDEQPTEQKEPSVLDKTYDWRRQGLGLFLMGAIQSFLYMRNEKVVRPCILQVGTSNKGACAFYERCGWNRVVPASEKQDQFEEVKWLDYEKTSLKRQAKDVGLSDARKENLENYEFVKTQIESFHHVLFSIPQQPDDEIIRTSSVVIDEIIRTSSDVIDQPVRVAVELPQAGEQPVLAGVERPQTETRSDDASAPSSEDQKIAPAAVLDKTESTALVLPTKASAMLPVHVEGIPVAGMPEDSTKLAVQQTAGSSDKEEEQVVIQRPSQKQRRIIEESESSSDSSNDETEQMVPLRPTRKLRQIIGKQEAPTPTLPKIKQSTISSKEAKELYNQISTLEYQERDMSSKLQEKYREVYLRKFDKKRMEPVQKLESQHKALQKTIQQLKKQYDRIANPRSKKDRKTETEQLLEGQKNMKKMADVIPSPEMISLDISDEDKPPEVQGRPSPTEKQPQKTSSRTRTGLLAEDYVLNALALMPKMTPRMDFSNTSMIHTQQPGERNLSDGNFRMPITTNRNIWAIFPQHVTGNLLERHVKDSMFMTNKLLEIQSLLNRTKLSLPNNNC